MPTVLDDRHGIKCRKKARCCFCTDPINIGNLMDRRTGVSDGDFWTMKMHPECNVWAGLTLTYEDYEDMSDKFFDRPKYHVLEQWPHWKPKMGDWFVLKASYCPKGGSCTDDKPCLKCLANHGNVFVISDTHYDKDFFFGGGWCTRSPTSHICDETHCAVLTIDKEKMEKKDPYTHFITEALHIEKPNQIL